MKNTDSYISNHQFDIIDITDDEFNLIRELIYSQSGIVLSDKKKSLVAGRLQKVLKQYQLNNFNDYYNELNKDKSGALLTELIDKISTNHTFFGRENDHFEYFKDIVLPELSKIKIESNNLDLRVWSAGCSTGEEAYTLAFIIREFFKNNYNKWDMGVLATDISSTVLSKAMQGIYDGSKFHGFNSEWTLRYFKKIDDNKWEVIPEIKSEIVFRRFNLLTPKFCFKTQMDVIFCRNVMIYFDKQTRAAVIQNLYDTLTDGGYLFIGHSEAIDRTQTKFQYISPSIYKK
ncbi:MAG: protein-glutamate O-methyltransferase CheR [Methanobacterium sp.]